MPRYTVAARVHEIPPGTSKVIREGELQIAVFNLEGFFYAIDNACPHSGGPLAKGRLEGDVVECPWHGWQFNVKTGCSPIIPEASIRTYPTHVEGGKILVALDLP